MPTIIIKVDLECRRCRAKIKKVLDTIREKGQFVIDDIEYDEKKNRVIVKGPFDADKLADKLCCKACNIIKEIEIVEPESTKKGESKPPPPETDKKPPPPPDTTVKPPPPPPPAQPKVVEVPYPCPYPYPFPAWPSGCCCHHGHGGCHCCTCARQDPPPAPAPAPQYIVLPPYPCGGYTMVCEEDPPGACAIM